MRVTMLRTMLRWWALALMVVLLPDLSLATTVERMSWPELAADADFVGVIECSDAGGIKLHSLELRRRRITVPQKGLASVDGPVEFCLS